jgi:hypothetical protein
MFIFEYHIIITFVICVDTLTKLKEYEKYEDRQNEGRRYLSCFILDKIGASANLTQAVFKSILEKIIELVIRT